MSALTDTRPPTLRRFIASALYLGIAAYGGGPAIIAMMRDLFVVQREWLHDEDLHTAISISQLLPGAQAVSVITYLGYRLAGTWGALLGSVFFLTPCFLLMLLLSALYFAFGGVPLVHSIFTGLGAVVVAILTNATVTMGRSALIDLWSIFIALATAILLYVFHPPFFVLILTAACVGWLLYRQRIPPNDDAARVIPTPVGSWFWWTSGILLAACTALLIVTHTNPITRLVLEMLHVGALTFGGGFTAIALFQHEAVEVMHWLTPRAFLDGLALGQVTPGPIFITSTFIGYAVLGPVGALCGTLAVFFPGAFAAFLAAHLPAATFARPALRAMVRGVVAAFIGVLITTTFTLAQTSLIDWRTWFVASSGVITLLLFKRDPLWVIFGGVVLSIVLFR